MLLNHWPLWHFKHTELMWKSMRKHRFSQNLHFCVFGKNWWFLYDFLEKSFFALSPFQKCWQGHHFLDTETSKIQVSHSWFCQPNFRKSYFLSCPKTSNLARVFSFHIFVFLIFLIKSIKTIGRAIIFAMFDFAFAQLWNPKNKKFMIFEMFWFLNCIRVNTHLAALGAHVPPIHPGVCLHNWLPRDSTEAEGCVCTTSAAQANDFV